MADRADVRSLEQLDEFLQHTEAFRVQLLRELENLTFELRRLTNWLSNDALGYWTDELVKAQRRWSECRDSLSRCLSYVRPDEKRPCTDEKKRLQAAELRLELCQQKLKTNQAAIVFWEAELTKQHTKIARCRDLADADMQVACHQLRDQIERLRAYAGLRSTAFSSSPTASSESRPASASDAATNASMDPKTQPPADPQEPA